MDTDELLSRLATVEGRVLRLQNEVNSIRLALTTRTAVESLPTPVKARPRQPLLSGPVQAPTPAPSASTPAAPTSRPARREFDLAELFGAKPLAWAGGVVTL